MYKSLNTGMLGHSMKFESVCAEAQNHGFEGVDISARELMELSAGGVKDVLEAHGRVPGVVGLPLDFRGTQAEMDESLERLPALAREARQAGYSRTTAVIMPGDGQRDFQENFDFHVTRLRRFAEILDYHGIRLGLEFIGPKTLRDTLRHPFVYTMDGVRALCAAIGTPNMGLLVDLFHLFTSHTPVDAVKSLSNHEVVLVHVNDGQAGLEADEQMDLVRDLPGANGVTDCPALLVSLDAIGYDGPVSVEPFLRRFREIGATEAIRETGESLAKVWGQAGL